MQTAQLIFIVISFYLVGSIIDYWQSAQQHKKYLPKFILDYFHIFWLLIYSGLLPFLLVYVSSSYNLHLAQTFLGALFIGMSVWDLVFSLLDTKSLVSTQEIYFFLKNKNFGLTKHQLYIWHVIRWVIGFLLLVN